MPTSGLDFSPAELSEQLEADRLGQPYLVLRERGWSQRLVKLGNKRRLTIGRESGSDLLIDWDTEVSRAHAMLERVGGRWSVVDDGLSRNGTFVNGERIRGRRVLSERDVLRFGGTAVLFRNPAERHDETPLAKEPGRLVRLSDAQRRVLVALCRPAASPGEVLVAASNVDIASELSISVEAVRSQLKALFQRFEIPELPPNRKRAELARRALAAGIVTQRDLAH